MQPVEVPERLKGFPFYKGMLVHFTVFVGDNGIPDFKVVHENNRMKCMKERLCALCGQALVTPMVFIGGEGTIQHSLFVDGPMHEECARYACQVCPYLRCETWQHRDAEPLHKGQSDVIFKTYEEVPISRPKMGLYFTDGYDIVLYRDNLYYRAASPLYVVWDAMPQPPEQPHEQ